jgi:hypothetical protein
MSCVHDRFIKDCLDLFEKLEWRGETLIDYEVPAECCPSCGGVHPRYIDHYEKPKCGHAPDCELIAALRVGGRR